MCTETIADVGGFTFHVTPYVTLNLPEASSCCLRSLSPTGWLVEGSEAFIVASALSLVASSRQNGAACRTM